MFGDRIYTNSTSYRHSSSPSTPISIRKKFQSPSSSSERLNAHFNRGKDGIFRPKSIFSLATEIDFDSSYKLSSSLPSKDVTITIASNPRLAQISSRHRESSIPRNNRRDISYSSSSSGRARARTLDIQSNFYANFNENLSYMRTKTPSNSISSSSYYTSSKPRSVYTSSYTPSSYRFTTAYYAPKVRERPLLSNLNLKFGSRNQSSASSRNHSISSASSHNNSVSSTDTIRPALERNKFLIKFREHNLDGNSEKRRNSISWHIPNGTPNSHYSIVAVNKSEPIEECGREQSFDEPTIVEQKEQTNLRDKNNNLVRWDGVLALNVEQDNTHVVEEKSNVIKESVQNETHDFEILQSEKINQLPMLQSAVIKLSKVSVEKEKPVENDKNKENESTVQTCKLKKRKKKVNEDKVTKVSETVESQTKSPNDQLFCNFVDNLDKQVKVPKEKSKSPKPKIATKPVSIEQTLRVEAIPNQQLVVSKMIAKHKLEHSSSSDLKSKPNQPIEQKVFSLEKTKAKSPIPESKPKQKQVSLVATSKQQNEAKLKKPEQNKVFIGKAIEAKVEPISPNTKPIVVNAHQVTSAAKLSESKDLNVTVESSAKAKVNKKKKESSEKTTEGEKVKKKKKMKKTSTEELVTGKELTCSNKPKETLNVPSSDAGLASKVSNKAKLQCPTDKTEVILKTDVKQKSAPKKIRFREYNIEDFVFLTMLGRGSFGKVLLAELRNHDCLFAVKCLKKQTVIEDDDVESIMIERKVLAFGSNSAFICKLFCTFQTESHLFFAMEWCSGGDLMFHVQKEGKFSEDKCRFYACEILCALQFLHKRGIIYRDLKLDNIMIYKDGHIRLVDFGMCQGKMYREELLPSNFCGTPEYMAPEIIKGVKYNHSVDYWAFGIVIYEMCVGTSPFQGTDEDELLWNVCHQEVHYPRYLSSNVKNLVVLLLKKNPAERLGTAPGHSEDIFSQPWLQGVNWKLIEQCKVKPPFIPELTHDADCSYFDQYFTKEDPCITPNDKTISEKNQQLFEGFNYTNHNMTE